MQLGHRAMKRWAISKVIRKENSHEEGLSSHWTVSPHSLRDCHRYETILRANLTSPASMRRGRRQKRCECRIWTQRRIKMGHGSSDLFVEGCWLTAQRSLRRSGWSWAPRIWDPQAPCTNLQVAYSSPFLPFWL